MLFTFALNPKYITVHGFRVENLILLCGTNRFFYKSTKMAVENKKIICVQIYTRNRMISFDYLNGSTDIKKKKNETRNTTVQSLRPFSMMMHYDIV